MGQGEKWPKGGVGPVKLGQKAKKGKGENGPGPKENRDWPKQKEEGQN